MNNNNNTPPGKIPTKAEYLTSLNTDRLYYEMLKSIPDVEERKRVKARVENFATMMYDALLPAFSAAQQDPTMLSKISEALKNGAGIIKENDGSPITSGSKG